MIFDLNKAGSKTVRIEASKDTPKKFLERLKGNINQKLAALDKKFGKEKVLASSCDLKPHFETEKTVVESSGYDGSMAGYFGQKTASKKVTSFDQTDYVSAMKYIKAPVEELPEKSDFFAETIKAFYKKKASEDCAIVDYACQNRSKHTDAKTVEIDQSSTVKPICRDIEIPVYTEMGEHCFEQPTENGLVNKGGIGYNTGLPIDCKEVQFTSPEIEVGGLVIKF